MWTGPTRCGTLRLVLKHFIILQSCKKLCQAFAPIVSSEVSSEISIIIKLHKNTASVYKWASIIMLTKEAEACKKGASLIPLSHGDKQGDTGNTSQDLMEEVASIEEVFSQMGTPSMMPFRSTKFSRSSS